jgi:sugar/nucleoside kinase (ribokinase family)
MTSHRVLFAGRTTLDVVYSLDQFPAEDTKVFARAMRAAPGGPATNAAITHALLGGRAVLMAAIGTGPWAAGVRGELDRLEIDVIDLAAGTAYETPLTTVLVNEQGATRTIVNPPRGEVELGPVGAWNAAWGALPSLVLTDGFHLRETLPLLCELRAGGAQICLDGGSWKPGTEALAPLLSVAICSERFAVPGQSADRTIHWFAEMGVPCVAITRGARTILGWDRGRSFEIEIRAVEAVDTLGAGDVLHGAFCCHFAQTGDFEASLRKASRIATESCRGPGIHAWIELEGIGSVSSQVSESRPGAPKQE